MPREDNSWPGIIYPPEQSLINNGEVKIISNWFKKLLKGTCQEEENETKQKEREYKKEWWTKTFI